MFSKRFFFAAFAFLFIFPNMGCVASSFDGEGAADKQAMETTGWFSEFPKGKGRAAETNKPKKDEVKIVPHRAIYNMSLASAKSSSNIAGISGHMLFEWGDSCDGWPVQQHLALLFNYIDGDESEVKSTVISWESKKGDKYNFNVRRTVNGREMENLRGQAVMQKDGGTVKYSVPEDAKEIQLTAETLFPSAHTKIVLEKAISGEEKFFTKRVFDGSDEEGQADISAFIGNKNDQIIGAEPKAELRENPLLIKQDYWPVRLAFFKPSEESGEPDYEMNLILQANGVARYLFIDYGDFSVSGVLNKIEPLEAVGCGN